MYSAGIIPFGNASVLTNVNISNLAPRKSEAVSWQMTPVDIFSDTKKQQQQSVIPAFLVFLSNFQRRHWFGDKNRSKVGAAFSSELSELFKNIISVNDIDISVKLFQGRKSATPVAAGAPFPATKATTSKRQRCSVSHFSPAAAAAAVTTPLTWNYLSFQWRQTIDAGNLIKRKHLKTWWKQENQHDIYHTIEKMFWEGRKQWSLVEDCFAPCLGGNMQRWGETQY